MDSISCDPKCYCPTSNWRITNSQFTQIKQIGEFSTDENKKMSLDRSEARFLQPDVIAEDVNFDLHSGYDTFSYLPWHKFETIHQFLQYILEKARSTNTKDLSKIVENAKVVASRGALEHIGYTIYEYSRKNDKGLTMLFCTFKAITFVCEIKADYLNKNGNVKDDLYELKAYKGHNFETFVSRKENSENRETVSYESGYNAIFASTLGAGQKDAISLAYKAEIDCFDPGDGKMIELKTNQTENFSPSWALQAWLQSHLVNVQTLVVGTCDHDSNVQKVKKIPIDSLLEQVKNNRPEACINFLHAFLKNVLRHLAKLDEETILIAKRLPHKSWFNFTNIDRGAENYIEYDFLLSDFKKYFA